MKVSTFFRNSTVYIMQFGCRDRMVRQDANHCVPGCSPLRARMLTPACQDAHHECQDAYHCVTGCLPLRARMLTTACQDPHHCVPGCPPIYRAAP